MNPFNILIALSVLTVDSYSNEPIPSQEKELSEKLFSLQVRKILSSKCISCHGADNKIKGGLNLTSLNNLMQGGDSGEPSITPKEPDSSPLFLSISRHEQSGWKAMPPKENDKLTDIQIKTLYKWIKTGAQWPDEKTQKLHIIEERSKKITNEGVIVETSGGLSEDWTYRRYKSEDLWAFEKLKDIKIPEGYDNPIDAFIGEKLKKIELDPAP
ncbi:MAG: c-type cytochrome domain-containing protein, partial [Verrucomicrobiales bacterium]